MLNSFKALKAGRLSEVDQKLLFPLLRWCSGSERDLAWCSQVNRLFFGLDPAICRSLLWVGLRDKNAFVKYPKAAKVVPDKAQQMREEVIARYYGWGPQELERNRAVLHLVDIEEVADALGLDNKERKVLGLKKVDVPKQPKVVKQETPKVKTLLDF